MAVVIDKIEAAKNTLTGDGVRKAFSKASSHEIIAPKRKHVDYLIACTNEPTVSMPELGTVVFERVRSTNWIVSFKALIAAHFLMSQGNERFLQYLAPRTVNFETEHLTDRSTVEAMSMSAFLRKYARYLNSKASVYHKAGFDYCRVIRGEGGFFRTMDAKKLMSHLVLLSGQFDSLLIFDPHPSEVVNPVIYAAFVRCFKDLIKLYGLYNEGIILLLEHYFDFKKQQAVEGIEIYKRFLNRCDSAKAFLIVASEIGIEDDELKDSPSSLDLLSAMEAHISDLDGKTSPGANSTPTTSPPVVVLPEAPRKGLSPRPGGSFSPQPAKLAINLNKLPSANSDTAIYATVNKTITTKPVAVESGLATNISALDELTDLFCTTQPAPANSTADKIDPWTGDAFPPSVNGNSDPFQQAPAISFQNEKAIFPISGAVNPTLFDNILEPERISGQPQETEVLNLGGDLNTGLERTFQSLDLISSNKKKNMIWEEKKDVVQTGGISYQKLPPQASTITLPSNPGLSGGLQTYQPGSTYQQPVPPVQPYNVNNPFNNNNNTIF